MEPDRGFLTSWISNPERIDRSAGGDTLRERRMFAERVHRYRHEPTQAIRADICLPQTHVTEAAHLGLWCHPLQRAGFTSNGLLSRPVPSGICSHKIAPVDLRQILAPWLCARNRIGFWGLNIRRGLDKSSLRNRTR